jgi:hypothetical protein
MADRRDWVTWGNTQQITIQPGIAAANPLRNAYQLVQIVHDRPISWRFMFDVRLISVDPTAVIQTLFVDFNLYAGLGQAKYSLAELPTAINQQGFARFVFVGSPLDPQATNAHKWTSQAITPNLDDRVTPAETTVVESVVAQNIQLDVSTLMVAIGLTKPTVIQVTAAFAPVENVDPGWFLGEPDGG